MENMEYHDNLTQLHKEQTQVIVSKMENTFFQIVVPSQNFMSCSETTFVFFFGEMKDSFRIIKKYFIKLY